MLFLEILEQPADALEIGQRRGALEEMRLTPDDQPLVVRFIARPGRKARLDHLGGELVELARDDIGVVADIPLHLADGLAFKARC